MIFLLEKLTNGLLITSCIHIYIHTHTHTHTHTHRYIYLHTYIGGCGSTHAQNLCTRTVLACRAAVALFWHRRLRAPAGGAASPRAPNRGDRGGINSEKFHLKSFIVTLCSEYTGALTFQNFFPARDASTSSQAGNKVERGNSRVSTRCA